MMNLMEFIQYYNVHNERNIVLLNTASDNFAAQMKTIGSPFELEYISLFKKPLPFLKTALFNKMPLKLYRLWMAKKIIQKLLKTIKPNAVILGNHSNFVGLYLLQQCEAKKIILDDGTGTILVAEKRKKEIKEKIISFEMNKKKRALGLVKWVMDFKNYKIPQELIFFSNYSVPTYGKDTLVKHQYAYLKNNYNSTQIDTSRVMFIGSPIAETGHTTMEDELKLLLKLKNHYVHSAELVYVAHRLDSAKKLSLISEQLGIEVLQYDLPIEYALTEKALPFAIYSFFTSALPVLAGLVPDSVKLYAIKIPVKMFISEYDRERIAKVYRGFDNIPKINIIVDQFI